MITLHVYSDPGHAWLRLRVGQLKGFCPSQYSYVSPSGRYVYLEEDCDLPGWLRHVGLEPEHRRDDGAWVTKSGDLVRLVSHYSEKTRIRDYPRCTQGFAVQP